MKTATTEQQTIPPEEAEAIRKFTEEGDTISLGMRIINGTEPVRKAALEAIKDLTKEKVEPSIQEKLRAWLSRCLGRNQ